MVLLRFRFLIERLIACVERVCIPSGICWIMHGSTIGWAYIVSGRKLLMSLRQRFVNCKIMRVNTDW